MSKDELASWDPLGMIYFFVGGQPGLPGHSGGGNPQHTAARKGCSDLLWVTPVLITAPIISTPPAMILRIFFNMAFLLTGRKASTVSLTAHLPSPHQAFSESAVFSGSARAMPQRAVHKLKMFARPYRYDRRPTDDKHNPPFWCLEKGYSEHDQETKT
jgi:hypothetical protein